MARGFESKSVTDQQESAASRWSGSSPFDPPDPEVSRKKRRLELSRVDVLRQLDAARVEAHRATLLRALEALDQDLAVLAARRSG